MIGRAIKAHRVAAGLSHAALAERAGVLSRFALSRIETGREPPPALDDLAALAGALGVAVADLRAGRGPATESPPPKEPPPMTTETTTTTPATPNVIPGVDALSALVAQRAELDKQIEDMRAAQRAQVIVSIREAIAIYSISADEIQVAQVRRKPGRKPGQKAAQAAQAAQAAAS